MVRSMEKLALSIKSFSHFKDALKVCYRLALKIAANHWVQFGLFIGLFGLLVALIGQSGFLVSSVMKLVKEVCLSIVTRTLMPVLGEGAVKAVERFMQGGEDSLECKYAK